MIKLLLLLKKIHYVMLFLTLECISLYSYTNSTPHSRSYIMQTTINLTGTLHNKITNISDYFALARQNEELAAQNAKLQSQLTKITVVDTTSFSPDTLPPQLNIRNNSEVISAKVIRNSYTKQNNYITLNKGTSQGIHPNMALFNDRGIVGYTLRCSENFTVALSTLNTSEFRTGGRLKGTDFTGSISWDGANYQYLTIEEVPKYADIQVGDTIITTFSNIFPENLPVGTIESYQMTSGTFYTARIKMFADMSALGYVYATTLADQQEQLQLETQTTTP